MSIVVLIPLLSRSPLCLVSYSKQVSDFKMAESTGLVMKQLPVNSGIVMKKSILPHSILRELHSDIELMLTNCRKTVNKNDEKLIDLGPKSCLNLSTNVSKDLVVTDDDSNLVAFCRTLEKALRDI